MPVERPEMDEEMSLMLLVQREALVAYPVGTTAERLRLERLHRQRDKELRLPDLSRNYGALFTAYGKQMDEVTALTPNTPFRGVLDDEISTLHRQSSALYPKAKAVFTANVFETSFLETFLSNYPDSPEAPDAALMLGDAYARLNRPADAVTQYLKCWQGHHDTPSGQKARLGLKNLTPVIDQLSSLQELAVQKDDAELAQRNDGQRRPSPPATSSSRTAPTICARTRPAPTQDRGRPPQHPPLYSRCTARSCSTKASATSSKPPSASRRS